MTAEPCDASVLAPTNTPAWRQHVVSAVQSPHALKLLVRVSTREGQSCELGREAVVVPTFKELEGTD